MSNNVKLQLENQEAVDLLKYEACFQSEFPPLDLKQYGYFDVTLDLSNKTDMVRWASEGRMIESGAFFFPESGATPFSFSFKNAYCDVLEMEVVAEGTESDKATITFRITPEVVIRGDYPYRNREMEKARLYR